MKALARCKTFIHSRFPHIIAILLLLLIGSQAFALEIPLGSLKLNEAKDGQDNPIYALEISGGITYPMADNLKTILQSLKPNTLLLVLLNSPGGSTEEGKKMVDLLKEESAKGRPVSTSVENGSICASMCVPIYMQGKRRYAGEGSLFMFHGSTAPIFSNIPNFFETEEMLKIFVDAGMNKVWLQARRDEGVFKIPGAYWISGKELFDANANVITKLIPRHVKEQPWSAPVEPNLKPR